MSIKSDAEVYKEIERILKAAGENPLTCNDLFDDEKIKQHADNPNRVSDYLGHMWRRNLIQRWFAPKDSTARSRYAYTWIDVPETAQVKPIAPPLALVHSRPSKPNVNISEHDNKIVLDFDAFTITVERK